MKRETALKIIAFVFTASLLCSFAYVLQDIKYLIYSIVPCVLAIITYFNDKRK
ncbi:MAG: hypothetical protein ACK5NF_02560 [Bacilli bacterium]